LRTPNPITMFRTFALLALAASASAFTPTMKVNGGLQTKIASAVGAAAVSAGVMAGAPTESLAAAGTGAKLSLFGQAPMSSPYSADSNMYSPYSPFGDGADSVYNAKDAEEVKFVIGKVKESANRFPNFKGYIQKKTWLEVYSESQRQMYELRRNMNYLADYKGTKQVKAATKDFYVKFEKMTDACRVKNQAAALAAYDEAKAAFDAYLSYL